jgi:hypothetical protein
MGLQTDWEKNCERQLESRKRKEGEKKKLSGGEEPLGNSSNT